MDLNTTTFGGVCWDARIGKYAEPLSANNIALYWQEPEPGCRHNADMLAFTVSNLELPRGERSVDDALLSGCILKPSQTR